MSQPVFSIIAPCYNEEENVPRLYERVKSVMEDMGESWELVLINDGSRDETLRVMLEKRDADPRVKIINFARNFGHQTAVTAGMDFATGEAVVLIDADLQDPPELIKEMVEQWRAGYQVVYGVRSERIGESRFKKMTAKWFYRIIYRITDVDIPLDTGDFRLMDRRVVEAVNAMREHNRFVRGLTSWVGFRQTGVEYVRPAREIGETNYPLRKMVRLALDAITGFSYFPAASGGLFEPGAGLHLDCGHSGGRGAAAGNESGLFGGAGHDAFDPAAADLLSAVVFLYTGAVHRAHLRRNARTTALCRGGHLWRSRPARASAQGGVMNPEDRVLVGVINRKKDFTVLREQNWYRIPVDAIPRGIHEEYIAFFFSGKAFSGEHRGIRYYAERRGVERATRAQLLPDEADHKRAAREYYKVQLGELRAKVPPILNTDNRVVTFIYTTWDRFVNASEISHLFLDDDNLVDRVFPCAGRTLPPQTPLAIGTWLSGPERAASCAVRGGRSACLTPSRRGHPHHRRCGRQRRTHPQAGCGTRRPTHDHDATRLKEAAHADYQRHGCI